MARPPATRADPPSPNPELMTDTPTFTTAAVAAPHSRAAEAGRDVLAQGGNAIEAMVAMAATIAVVYPHMNAIGGDGFWLVREPSGKVHYLEACGPAGAGATIARYRDAGYDSIPSRGPLAALTVPGAVGGWALALELAKALGGRMPLDILLANALSAARDGYPVSPCEARTIPNEEAALLEAPGYRETYCDPDGTRPKAGEIRKPKALGDTLDQLAHAGLADFYRGDIAREMAVDLENIGSPVTRADLKKYEARTRAALSLKLPGVTLYNAPPPTQGLAALVILGLFERLGVRGAENFEHIHGLVEATKRGLHLRDRVCTDYEQLLHDPLSFLEPGWLDAEAAKIDMKRAAPFPLPAATGDTVWMGAIDSKGVSVSYIQSIYWDYGSGCVLPKTGVLMQNRGISFSLDPKAVNPLTPGRRPFHTLNPPLAVFNDGRVLSYGSMGGDGQPQFQAQVFSRIRFGQGLARAVEAPRFLLGKTWGASSTNLKLEGMFDGNIVDLLDRAGHDIDLRSAPREDLFGHAGALMRLKNGGVEATHDPRADGGAMGL